MMCNFCLNTEQKNNLSDLHGCIERDTQCHYLLQFAKTILQLNMVFHMTSYTIRFCQVSRLLIFLHEKRQERFIAIWYVI